MHPNSIATYHSLNLTAKQKEVYDAYQVFGRATDAQIAAHLGYTVNRVTGRIHELIGKGVLVECDTVLSPFGKPCRVCRIKEFNETLF